MVNVTLVQFTPVWNEPADNLEQIAQLVGAVQSDIFILPELCTTGYSFISGNEALSAADERGNHTFRFFSTLAISKQAMIIAGFVEKEGDKVYNAALVAMPDGEIKTYRKTHLFFREKECFNEGDSGFFVVPHTLKDCNVGIMVCNDWRYPEAARSLALLGADLIACPSNLISDVWRIGMPARALENKVFLAATNRCGTEVRNLPDGSTQSLTFTGGSVLYNFTGEVIEQAGRTEERIITIEIDPTLTRDKHFNEFNNLLADRRPEYYLR